MRPLLIFVLCLSYIKVSLFEEGEYFKVIKSDSFIVLIPGDIPSFIVKEGEEVVLPCPVNEPGI